MRHGAVIKFREGATEAEIAEALNKIRDILDLPEMVDEMTVMKDTNGKQYHKYTKVPFKWRHLVNKYDDQYGGPVWYIP